MRVVSWMRVDLHTGKNIAQQCTGGPEWPGNLRKVSKWRWAWKSTCTPAQRANNNNKPHRDDLPGSRSEPLFRAAAGRPTRTSNSGACPDLSVLFEALDPPKYFISQPPRASACP